MTKRFVFELVVEEGNDEFWEELRDNGLSGCDEITSVVAEALFAYGIDVEGEYANASLVLKRFEQ